MAKKRKTTKQLMGRDTTYGRVAFSTSVIPMHKTKLKNRNSKAARNQLKDQLQKYSQE